MKDALKNYPREPRPLDERVLTTATYLMLRADWTVRLNILMTILMQTDNAGLMEDSLIVAWLRAVLKGQVKDAARDMAQGRLLALRYDRSKSEPTSRTSLVTWRREALWQWLAVLQHFLGLLLDNLEASLAHESPEVDDEAVLLATVTAAAIHAVKRSFRATEPQMQWQEVECLLLGFVAAHKRCAVGRSPRVFVEAAVITVPRRVVQHLEAFRVKLTKHVVKYSGAAESTLEELARWPEQSREAVVAAARGGEAALYRDCAALWDLRFWEPTVKYP